MKAILVLGTGRSGTSALAGSLQLLGGFCGNNLRESNAQNPKGYFEDKNITTLNNYILKALLKIPWYDPSVSLYSIKPAVPTAELIALIKYAVHLAYGKSPVIVLKDPRLCLLLYCYREALIRLGYEIYYLHIQRSESETCTSLITGFPDLTSEDAEKMVKHYKHVLNKTMREVAGHSLTIQFDDLVLKTDQVLESLKSYLPFLDYSEENIKKVGDFLDPSIKHL